MDNLHIWNKLKRPPKSGLKQIKGGRMSGATNIEPQWRLKAMTELFGAVGTGWKYELKRVWTETLDKEIACFAIIDLFYKTDDGWSEPTPGLGGSMLLKQEKAGLHSDDEGYKKAITDALSVAMKELGVAADIYMGLWNGSKYNDPKPQTAQKDNDTPPPSKVTKRQGEVLDAITKFLRTFGNKEPDREKIKKIFINTKGYLPDDPEVVDKTADWLHKNHKDVIFKDDNNG